LGVLAIGIAVGGLVAGAVAIASPSSPNTTDVSFVELTPAKALATNVYIGAHATNSYLVIGGTATVPSDATTVQLTVVASGNTAGSLDIFPTGNPARVVHLPYTQDPVDSVVPMNVGMGDKVSFTNDAAKAGKLTVKIIGYSTQVTADGINGSGGSNGQVLTNNGQGAAEWREPRAPDLPAIYAFDNGFGAITLDASNKLIGSVSVPAGSYVVNASLTAANSVANSDYVTCQVGAPDGTQLARARSTPGLGWDSMSITRVVTTATGGPIRLACTTTASGTNTVVAYASISAIAGDSTP